MNKLSFMFMFHPLNKGHKGHSKEHKSNNNT